MPLLALTDDQLTIIRRLAEPLQYAARSAYLERVAQLLRDQTEIGDGIIHRAAEQAQKEFRRSPIQFNGKAVGSKYGR
jgi:hypothetical protein